MHKGAAVGDEVITFTVDDQRFGFFIEDVREVIGPTKTAKVPKAPPFVEGIINLRGRVVPILNLRKKLGLPEAKGRQEGVVLIEIDNRIVGLLVDKVEGILRIPKQSIGFPSTLKQGKIDTAYLTGVGESQEGAVVLLNPRKILEAE